MHCRECLVSVVILMLIIVSVDTFSGPEVSPWIAYGLPVALASRYCGFVFGAVYAVLAGLLICIAAKYSGHPFSTDWYFLLAVGWQVLALITIGWLVSRLATLQLSQGKALAARR